MRERAMAEKQFDIKRRAYNLISVVVCLRWDLRSSYIRAFHIPTALYHEKASSIMIVSVYTMNVCPLEDKSERSRVRLCEPALFELLSHTRRMTTHI